jgi:A/G-specific adenine glycosylase
MLLAENHAGEVLLQKRPPVGIWASLWSLPEAQDEEQVLAWFHEHLQGEVAAMEPLAEILHVFSHYRLRIQPLRWTRVAARPRVGDNAGLRWVARAELGALGLPAPIRKLLDE